MAKRTFVHRGIEYKIDDDMIKYKRTKKVVRDTYIVIETQVFFEY